MARELKKYGLRSVRKPALKYLLSSVVKVRDEEGRDGYCYVRFDEPLIEAVGKKLPRGVAPFDPAYLVAEYDENRQLWIVGARYLKTDEAVVLWETPDKPEWLKVVYLGNKNGNNRTEARGKTRPQSGRDEGSRAPSPLSHADDYSLSA